jgi:glutamate synthase domain-containing protein 2
VRMLPFLIVVAITIALIPLAIIFPAALILLAPLVILTGLGIWDLLQPHHNLLRNYPLIARFRWMFEALRPAIRQYLFESEADGRPFNREQRSLIYRRAKDVDDRQPFGTLLDYYAPGHEWINHSVMPTARGDVGTRVSIGGPDCARPYSASVFNISAMSFGSLSANAILALNKGARLGGFAHDTGEGGISRHHRQHGGDLIWEIGSGYFGCRTHDGRFDPAQFADNAADDQVRMIELKLSQGAKPGGGGILPGAKVTAEIAEARGVVQGQDCSSPKAHSTFSTPTQLLEFVARLRELSGGKPAGFKLCIGHPVEFAAIVKAMLETGITPDFIVIDGAEGGTGAAPLELSNRVGTPLREGLLLARNMLVGAGVRDRIRLGVSGKVTSGYQLATNMALGADWCNGARSFMFAIGCIQSLTCHTDNCPTGVATQNRWRQRALVVDDKAERVANFHRHTLAALIQIVAAAGLDHPGQLHPQHLQQRGGDLELRSGSERYTFLDTDALLDGAPEPFASWWRAASATSFATARHIA